MYRMLVTDQFVEMLSEVSIKYLPLIQNSFISIAKVNEEKEDESFLQDLIDQIRNQELE